MTEHDLSESDHGSLLSAHVGDVIELRLQELASAGYRWAIDSAHGDRLELLEQDAEYDSSKVGGANVARFRFRVRAAGTDVIRLTYSRPWETDEPPSKCFEATVVAS